MKLKEGFIFRKIGGQNILIPIGENLNNFNGLIQLNESADFLLKLLKNDVEKEFLVKSLIEEYDIDEKLALSDVESIIDTLNKKEMIEGI